MAVSVHVRDLILHPLPAVFEAVVDPLKITGYFATKSSGRLVAGETIIWEFADHAVSFPIEVVDVQPLVAVVFRWSASGHLATVQISFSEGVRGATQIEIEERFFELTEEGVALVKQQTQGWTDFLCSLKAYLYTGVNLRNGEMHTDQL